MYHTKKHECGDNSVYPSITSADFYGAKLSSSDEAVFDTVFSKLAVLQYEGFLNKIGKLETQLNQLESELYLFLSSNSKKNTE